MGIDTTFSIRIDYKYIIKRHLDELFIKVSVGFIEFESQFKFYSGRV